MNTRNGILAIGNLLVDRTLVISEYPKESMLATVSKIEMHCGGGCTNILFNLAKLDPNLPLFLSGAVGSDTEGAMILNQAKEKSINVDQVVSVDLPTSFTDVMINSQTGDRTFFHYIGAMGLYNEQHLAQIDCSAKIAHIAYLPLLPALLKRDILISALTTLRKKGFLISIDLVSVQEQSIFQDHIRPALPYIDFVIINDVEANILLEQNTTNLLYLAEEIYKLGVKQCVIIHSPQQAVAYKEQETATVQSYWVDKSNILSTLGAGDAFCTGVLYGLHNNAPLKETLKLGHGLAYFNLFSLSSTDGAVSYPELQHFIQTQA